MGRKAPGSGRETPEFCWAEDKDLASSGVLRLFSRKSFKLCFPQRLRLDRPSGARGQPRAEI